MPYFIGTHTILTNKTSKVERDTYWCHMGRSGVAVGRQILRTGSRNELTDHSQEFTTSALHSHLQND